jgi:ABC-type sugar transport system substrate-binding protein
MATASSSIACECIRGQTDLNLTIITTDLLRQTPEFLKNRLSTAVIFQNPYRQGKNVLRALYDHITQKTSEDVSLIAPHILLSSNVDAYLSEKNM